MRLDKFTTKFQQALGEAQSLAIGHDNQLIEPQHLLLALIEQEDGGTSSLLARAGVNVPALRTEPTCHNCGKILPPAPCTALTTFAQPASDLSPWK